MTRKQNEKCAKNGILNAIVPGDTISFAPIFLLLRESNLKSVIYDVVSLYWSGMPLVISHDDTNVTIFLTNRTKNTDLSHPSLMQFLKKGQTLPVRNLLLIFAYFSLTVQGH